MVIYDRPRVPAVTGRRCRCRRDTADVVVLTALPEEQRAFLIALQGVNAAVTVVNDNRVAIIGSVRVVLVSTHGMGNIRSAIATSRALDEWRPRHFVLVGLAAGIRQSANMRYGDLLVAEQVVGFELAKATATGLQPRFEAYRPNIDLLMAAKHIAVGPGVPRTFFGTILSGEKVFADGPSVERIRRVWPNAIGIEMEGLGVAAAAYRGRRGFLMVKGLTDFADASKNDQWRGGAAAAAARFAIAVLRSPAVQRAGGRRMCRRCAVRNRVR